MQISGSDLDEDVLRVERDLGVIAVDDRRHGEDHAVRIIDNRIHWLVFDYVQVMSKVTVFL